MSTLKMCPPAADIDDGRKSPIRPAFYSFSCGIFNGVHSGTGAEPLHSDFGSLFGRHRHHGDAVRRPKLNSETVSAS
jgi:hypothetical protein